MQLGFAQVGPAWFSSSPEGIKGLESAISSNLSSLYFQENSSQDQLFLIDSQHHSEYDTTMGPSQVDRKLIIEHRGHQKDQEIPSTWHTEALEVKVTLIIPDTYYPLPHYTTIGTTT